MPQIIAAQSVWAPAVAENNGNVFALWTAPNAQVTAAVYSLSTLSWSSQNIINASNSATRPAAAFWNGVFYGLHQGVSGDPTLYYFITDLAAFPFGVVSSGNQCFGIPLAFPYGERLIVTLNAAGGGNANNLNYVVLQGDWLTNGLSGLWGAPQSIGVTNNSNGASIAICPFNGENLWCAIFASNGALLSQSFCEQQPSVISSSQVPNTTGVISNVGLTVYDEAFYAAWVDSNLGCVYSVGTPTQTASTNTPSQPTVSISWGVPNAIIGVPQGVTDLTITAGTDGIFLGYCVPTTNIGVVQLTL